MANFTAPNLGMTFGIELEFIAMYPQGFFDSPLLAEGADAIAGISLALNAEGIDATGHESLDDDEDINSQRPAFSQWIVQEEGGLSLSHAEDSAMFMHGVGSRFDSENQDLDQCSVEISSRKLTFAEDWQTELRVVINVLEQMTARGCRFITNSSTGFHIHIGFGNTRMPLRTAKGVLQLCTAFEDRLDALYSLDRIDNNKAEMGNSGHFNAGLAWHFQNNKKTDFGRNICHWLAAIEEAPTFEALGDFFRNFVGDIDPECAWTTNSHWSTLNVDNLYPAPGKHDAPMNTIEFRQHAGTTDLGEVCAQILFMQTLASNEAFLLGDFLEAIGPSPELLAYHINRYSLANQSARDLQYLQAQALLEANHKIAQPGVWPALVSLGAQSTMERLERSNYAALSGDIMCKLLAGKYADLRMVPLDVAEEYSKFVKVNAAAFPDHAQLSSMSRTMIFQQLNAADDC